MNIKKKIEALYAAQAALFEEANKGSWSEENCPLARDHWGISGVLVGVGVCDWECPFCGKKFTA